MRLLAPVTAVLAYFLAVAGLHPRSVSFDGLAFLMGARAGTIDYGHALYLPLLGAAQALAGPLAPERSAQLVSALGAALAFTLLWRRVERGGAPRARAGLVAACFALSTLFWQEAGSIEPTTWTIAALLLAADATEAYARRPTWVRLGASVIAFGAAVGFHLVSLCALPWLLVRARKGLAQSRALPPRAHWIVPLGGALLALFLALLGGELDTHLRYWSGFVPDFGGGLWSELGQHLERGGRLFLEGAPVLIVAATLAALALGRRKAALLAEGAWLGGPYLLAFLILGKPLVGLLTPVLLTAALVMGQRAAEIRLIEGRAGGSLLEGRLRRLPGVVVALAAGLQFSLSLPQALEWRRAPDEPRLRAELLVRHLPEGALLFAGPLANHVRYYWPAVEVVSLPELWHRAHARDRSADPIEVVQQAVEASGRTCVLSTDGAGFLLGGLSADLARLGLTLQRAFFIPEDPSLALFPLGE